MEKDGKALKYALNILNRKDYTEFEMFSKLKMKGFDDNEINETIKYLKSNNFLNDKRYVENFVYFRLKNGYGKKRIEYDLKKKGIGEELINKYVNSADEMQSAKSILKAKAEHLKEDKNRRVKLFAFLARRGFNYEIINRLLNEEGEA